MEAYENGFNFSMYGNDSTWMNMEKDESVSFHSVTYTLNTYVTPIVIVIGVLGNTLSFVVFVATHLSRQSSSVYLAVLAAVDNVFLVILLFVW